MLDFYTHLVRWALSWSDVLFVSHLTPCFVKFYLLIKQLFYCLFFRLNHKGGCFCREYSVSPKLINRLIHSLCG